MVTSNMLGNHPDASVRRADFHSKVRLQWPEATGEVHKVTVRHMSKNARRKAARYGKAAA